MAMGAKKVAGKTSAVLRKKVQALATTDDGAVFELAEAMSDLRALPSGDRPSQAELVEITKLSKRTVCYLLAVWSRFGDLGILRQRLVEVGWTKLAIIAEHCAAGEERKALTQAETCTAKELPALLKGGPEKPKAHTVLLRLTPRQYENFETVLLAHGAKRPKKGRGLARKEQALMKALRQIAP